jgi:hypothetical protein
LIYFSFSKAWSLFLKVIAIQEWSKFEFGIVMEGVLGKREKELFGRIALSKSYATSNEALFVF